MRVTQAVEALVTCANGLLGRAQQRLPANNTLSAGPERRHGPRVRLPPRGDVVSKRREPSGSRRKCTARSVSPEFVKDGAADPLTVYDDSSYLSGGMGGRVDL